MNGDLSLSRSLGGLRIANPDDDDDDNDKSSPPPPSDTQAQAHTLTDAHPPQLPPLDPPSAFSVSAPSGSPTTGADQTPAISPTTSDGRPTISSHSSGSTITNLDRPRGLTQISSSHIPQQHNQFQHPSSTSANAAAAAAAADYGHVTPSEQQSPQQYNAPRPYRAASGGSDQLYRQRAGSYEQPHQFSRNPSVASTNLSGRPISTNMYTHQNASTSSALSQASSYRYRDDIPPQPTAGLARSASRAAAAAMAGLPPARSASRSYRGDAQNVLPPRRSSKRMPSGYGQGAPYSIEGGPLPSSEEWKERGAVVATRQETDQNGRQVTKTIKKGVKDFHFGRTLGEGSYSTVLAAADRVSGREYAVKVLDKRHIIKEKKVKYVNIEKDALNRLTDHPGIVRLYYTFQDERSLYFVLDLANGGELLGHLKRMGTFDEECTRFYGAQILDSIAYMHSKGIIHRDLKPENVLLDEQMHTKITDFGTAKILDIKTRPQDAGGTGSDVSGTGDPLDGAEQDRAVSFVGTAEYVSPELLTDKNACKASDLWAFGCIVYQLLAGRPPFKASNEYQTFQKIVALDYHFPDGFPHIARDLIERLLVLDPSKRLPIEHIRSHPFFEGIQWGMGLWKQKAPRLRNYVPGPTEPIRLNGGFPAAAAPAPNIPGIPMVPPSQPTSPPVAQASQQAPRPQLRAITELPPPSQLDIDWSPVLTRNNERIMKLGNLNVTSSPAPHSPTNKGTEETPRKFSRFFGGATTKKRQRLVMITSSARVIIAAAGGDEKKAKVEISLLATGASWKSYQDTKGLTAFSIDTRDKHLAFEDPRATTSDPDGSKYSTQEWIDCIERAKEVALSQSVANSYSGESQYGDLGSTISSPASASGGDNAGEQSGPGHSGRNTLRKDQGDNESVKSRKPRFSKRHSKSGLAAVF